MTGSGSAPSYGHARGEDLHRLEHFLTARLPAGAQPRVAALERIGSGRSRENWLATVAWLDGDDGPAAEELIIRRDPLGGLLRTDRSLEFAVLRALEATDVPAPWARWCDPAGEELGRPSLVMVREPGDCDYFVLGGDRPIPDRLDLARRLCDLLATVHQVDWAGAGLGSVLDDPGPGAALVAVDQWEAILRRDQVEPYPELELTTRWLRANAPTSHRTVLVHGDFKVGNVLLDDDLGIVALLDWELAHLGDLHEDLGWVAQPLRTREHFVDGCWGRDEILDHYERSAGVAVDRRAVRWWNVMSCYKTAVMQSSGLRSFLEGRSDEAYRPTPEVLDTTLELIGYVAN